MDSRIAGGILLMVGTCIGGGMLALPLVSSSSGFIASSLMLFGCWVVMTFSAFLILEVNLWLPSGNNLITMAKATLGLPGAIVTILSYVLLLYSLLAAYVSAGSALFRDLALRIGLPSPAWLNSILFVVVFGFIVYKGVKPVDYVNRGLMVIKLGSLFGLIVFTLSYVDVQKLSAGDPRLVVTAITVMLTSFGFANIIPSLRSYFRDDVKKLRIAVLIGSLIPLVCYILWNLVILGTLPEEGTDGFAGIIERGGAATDLTVSLSHYLNNSSITFLSSIFIAISVLTAFLCISLALSDFLADGFKINKNGKRSSLVHGLTFLPALIVVLFYPSIFVKALHYGGIFCTVLIVLLPAFMALSGRYYKKIATPHYEVIGGKPAVVLLIIVGFVILGFGVFEAFS